MSTSNKKSLSKAIPTTAFENQQLNLFQDFLCNTNEERDNLSNAVDLWDSIPRYSVSKQAMNKMRTKEGFLEKYQVNFNYRGKSFKATIQAARIEEENGINLDYYPSSNEELIEDALRKIAAEQQQGFFEKNDFRSGVVFSLYMLSEELKRRGHSRSYQEIKKSLEILANSTIQIRTDKGEKEDEEDSFAVSTYLPLLIGVSRKKLKEDPHARWVVQFHPLVTRSIDQVTYRQYNYHQMMSHNTQLARWLHKQLSLKFTFASMAHSFEIYYSTIKRDSALLNGYSFDRKAVKALDDSLEELKKQNILLRVEKTEIRGSRNKLEDVIYILFPTVEFVQEMKAANKRLKSSINHNINQ